MVENRLCFLTYLYFLDFVKINSYIENTIFFYLLRAKLNSFINNAGNL